MYAVGWYAVRIGIISIEIVFCKPGKIRPYVPKTIVFVRPHPVNQSSVRRLGIGEPQVVHQRIVIGARCLHIKLEMVLRLHVHAVVVSDELIVLCLSTEE